MITLLFLYKFVISGVLPEKKVEVQDNEMDLTVDNLPPIPHRQF